MAVDSIAYRNDLFLKYLPLINTSIVPPKIPAIKPTIVATRSMTIESYEGDGPRLNSEVKMVNSCKTR